MGKLRRDWIQHDCIDAVVSMQSETSPLVGARRIRYDRGMSEGSVHYTTCPLCEATCGIEIALRDGTISRVVGDRQDVFGRGFICPKGASLAQVHDDPDRLRAPLVREAGGEFREVSWEDAFAHVEARLLSAIREDRRSAAIYLGNPNVHSIAGTFLPRELIRALGTRNVFSATTVDQMPKYVACGLMYGDPYAISVPDLDRTDYLLVLGANPWASNGSLCTAPDFPGRVKQMLERGGRLVVVDPRRTRTAEHASEHIRIRPGSDAHLLLGIAHVAFRDGLVRLGPLASRVAGLEQLREQVGRFRPEVVAARTGVPAETVERLARELAETPRAVVYGRIGTQTVPFGTLAAWAVDLLNLIFGHLDVPGGAMWARPAHAPERAKKSPDPHSRGSDFKMGRWTSRVHGYPEVVGEFPVATLGDEIETPGDGQVRVLITVAGNPLLSAPNSAQLERALPSLRFMLSVDPYLNETTRHAHVILPPPSPLTRSHYDFNLAGLAVRNRAKWSPPLFAGDGPSEAEILARLALIAAGEGASADPNRVLAAIEAQMLRAAIRRHPQLHEKRPEALASALVARDPLDRYVEIMIRAGVYGDAFGEKPGGLTFERLRESPHGIDLGPLEPQLADKLRTASGCIELMSEPIRRELARLVADLAAPPAAELVLIGRRDLRSNNSWMHNVPNLMRGRPRCTLQIHPDDAVRLSILDGQPVHVKSSAGQLSVVAEICDSLMPGVVSLPHGFGHDRPGTRQRVAEAHAGANFNLLTDSTQLDPLSGNAVLNGIEVQVSPA